MNFEIIVKKFGGTSVKDTTRIKLIAEIIAQEIQKGNKVIAVTSAMAGVTDQLIENVHNICIPKSIIEKAEYDSIISSGEQITSGLLALALCNLGFKARSWLGWQLPIIAMEDEYLDNKMEYSSFTKGKIQSVNIALLMKSLEADEIPIIAGFQAIHNNRIVTLGRGGSDTTAATVAAFIKAKRCDIYTDVEGIFTLDPRIADNNTKKLDKISYEAMLEMACSGAKVLHKNAVKIAMENNLPIKILSSFNINSGTMVISKVDDKKEGQNNIVGITLIKDEVLLMMDVSKNLVGTIMNYISSYYKNNILLIEQVKLLDNNDILNIKVMIKKDEMIEFVNNLERLDNSILNNISINSEVARISIIKEKNQRKLTDTQQKMDELLRSQNISILALYKNNIRISIVVNLDDIKVVRLLHRELI